MTEREFEDWRKYSGISKMIPEEKEFNLSEKINERGQLWMTEVREFIRLLKEDINKLTIFTKTDTSPILVRRAYVLEKIDKRAGEKLV